MYAPYHPQQIAKAVEIMRLGELMFVYRDRYGLTVEMVKEVLAKTLREDEYSRKYGKLVKFCEDHYMEIISKGVSYG